MQKILIFICLFFVADLEAKEEFTLYPVKHYIKLKSKIIIFEKNYMQHIIENKKEELISICKFLKIQRMNIFGSVVSGNFNKDSDIDLLISFSDKLTIDEYTNNYFTLHYKLRELFNRDIDIVTERTLSNPYFIESINETKELIYEALY